MAGSQSRVTPRNAAHNLIHRPQSRALNPLPRRAQKETIHILGLGAVGKLVAHALRSQGESSPPVTLLLHRVSRVKQWLDSGKQITLRSHGSEEKSSGYEAELVTPLPKSHKPDDWKKLREDVDDKFKPFVKDDMISHLIVSVKAMGTVIALNGLKHRLDRNSSILFLQNGMGMLEEVNETVFPDPETRPTYLMGINSHGITEVNPFAAIHAGQGTMSLSILPRSKEDASVPDKARALLQEIISIPLLAAVPVDPIQLQQLQLEKLAVNCILNPLTVMFDCRNGDLLYNNYASRVFRLLLAEICIVIQNMPELQSDPNLLARFNPARLETIVRSIAERTGRNISSMLQDVRRGRLTEIDYINGYIVRRGEDLGIKCVMNYMLMQMVMGKGQMIKRELDTYTPMEVEGGRRSRL